MTPGIRPDGLQERAIQVQGRDRIYWLARPAPEGSPLLIVLHGSGLDGPRMAAWTGLAERGPAAGLTTVFPDAARQMWDDGGLGRRDGLDDAAFIAALAERLGGGPRWLAGLSNGAFFAERLARHGLVDVAGIALVAGGAREASRRVRPRPARPAAFLAISGTEDRAVPYPGGLAGSLMGSLARRRSRQVLSSTQGREAVAAETVAADWAAVNGCPAEPLIEAGLGPGADRLSWTAPGRPPVVLYRVVGGGHGWPGGPQYAPRFLVGEVRQALDATGIVLDFVGGRAGSAGA